MSETETGRDGTDVGAAADEVEGRDGFPPVGAVAGLFGLYVLTIVGGFALAQPFDATGVQTFEDPGNVANVGLIFVEILIVTAVFIAIQRFGYGQQLLRLAVLAVFGYASNLAVTGTGLPGTDLAGPALGVAVFVALFAYPEWYVIDAAAVIAGAAIIAQFGNGLGPLPALVFLVGMAAYDAYAVYVSEHMQQLGGGIGELKLPMMYVVPPTLSFSMSELGDPFEEAEEDAEPEEVGETDGERVEAGEVSEDGERVEAGEASEDGETGDDGMEEADRPAPGEDTPILLGLGDAIVPGLLAVSAGQFLPADPLIAGTILNAPALGAIVGSVVGLAGLTVLLYAIERAHAGLPVLNACVIAGYLAGALAAGVPVATALGL
ncbi:MAG: presenilin family intramembrane aspartyl protease PSH [Halobacteriales archaeon]